MPALEKTDYSLYGGAVKLTFDPKAKGRAPRYVASYNGKVTPVRGVTTILKDILHKPDLMRWHMNMSHSKLFGAKFDEVLLDYTHDWDKALLKPDTAFTEQQLHDFMLAGARAATEKQEYGADIGSLAHAAVELYLKDSSKPVEEALLLADTEVSGADRKVLDKIVAKFSAWWESLIKADPKTKVIYSERPIFSVALNYAGTFDLCIMHKNVTYLLDFKTTNRSRVAPLGIYPDYFLQLGGYSHALAEEGLGESGDLGIVNVGKDGQLGVMTASDMGLSVNECERAFAFAVRLHDWLEVNNKMLGQSRQFVSPLNPLAMVDKQVAN